MQGFFKRNSGWLVTLAAVAALGAGGWAVAAGGSSSDIHACYAKRTGALRIAKSCRKGERPISWSKVGPQGPAGERGASGPPGQAGADGSARAYAYVIGSVSEPSFDPNRTKGFTSVSEPAKGVYCLTAPGVDATMTVPAVTAVYNSGFAGQPTAAKFDGSNEFCGFGQLEVRTTEIQAGLEKAVPNLSFTVVVP
jgi:hypothetical protein